MTPTKPSADQKTEGGQYDPFSYPRLYPSGWNLDEMPNSDAAEPKPEPMPDWYEPFHDLRTFPAGWDLP